MRYDLHIHSNFSDGRDGVEKILKAAMDTDLDGIVITDHDTLKGALLARRLIEEQKLDLNIIPGVEVTTSEGHLLALGVEEVPPRKKSPEETIEIIHSLGGIAIVPHPFHLFRHPMLRIPNCDAVEVYNSKHFFGIANFLARRQTEKLGLPMVAGSDSHVAETVGLGVTLIDVGNSDDVLGAIRAGKTTIIGRKTPLRLFPGQMARWVRRTWRKHFR